MDTAGSATPGRSVRPEGQGGSVRPVSGFPFDPNTIDEGGWRALGLDERKVRTILRYRDKGGRFRKPADLARIYGLSQAEVARLEPWVRIPPPEDRRPPPAAGRAQGDMSTTAWPDRRAASSARVEINTADSLAWLALPGIGPGWAHRILRYRSSLGGFIGVDQVAETFGLPDSVFQRIRALLEVDTSRSLRRLDLNRDTEERLAAHPYLSRREARAIVAYRERHGPYARLEDIGRVALISAEVVERIRPYARVD
jgi:DNA uptake protein ComE-like DNA-binding protein